MPVVNCPRPDCDYCTDDVEAILVAALLSAHTTIHLGGGNNQSSHIRPPPMERPKLLPNCPRADWEVFVAKWRSFKAATGVASDKMVHQLLGCLDSELSSLVYNEHASPETLEEKQLIDLVKKVSVKPENIWIARELLHTMKQDVGEPVTSYAARLRGQARLCGFKAEVQCARAGCNQLNTYDFTDTVVMGNLVRGLSDNEIKSIVLGEVQQETELNGLIKLIQAKEYGHLSTS